MEKFRFQLAAKYYLLSCNRYHVFRAHKEYEESLLLTVTNNSGSICFTFIDLSTNEETKFDNPTTGEYIIPLKKGVKTKLIITASKANGAYKIVKKTVK